MHRSSRGPLHRMLCGGGWDPTVLDTHMEVLDEDEMDTSLIDEDDNGESADPFLFCTPPQRRAKVASREYVREEAVYSAQGESMLYSSPPSSRVMSPLSSESSWSPEPRSPVEWSDDYDTVCDRDKPSRLPDPPFLPSLFSPWMCVFDLDAACGSGNAVVDDGDRHHHSMPKSPSSTLPKDWNHLLPPLDLSQWFGRGEKDAIPEAAKSTTSPSGSPAIPNGAPLLPFRPIPLYPPPALNGAPNQFFTDFASDHSIEAIFVPPPSVCFIVPFHYRVRCIR
jgi:hypothetical protein